MRGIYSAAYLDALTTAFAKQRNVAGLDFGRAFRLICGTSTGAILACAAAKGVSFRKVMALYEEKGRSIFPQKVPDSKLGILGQLFRRSDLNRRGAEALRTALAGELGETRVIDIWRDRGIALAITAVEMSRHRSWIFKTPHLATSKNRDDNYSLVDVCMATTAAPVFRSIAWLPNPDTAGGHAFVDGGLWANNPVLVGLIDALEMTSPGDRIEIYCLGTCPPPSGDQVGPDGVDWGYTEWKFGANAASVGISAQQYAYDNMARMFAKHVKDRTIDIVRFPHGTPLPTLLPYLALDETSKPAMKALIEQGQTDAYKALSDCGDSTSKEGPFVDRLMRTMPAI